MQCACLICKKSTLAGLQIICICGTVFVIIFSNLYNFLLWNFFAVVLKKEMHPQPACVICATNWGSTTLSPNCRIRPLTDQLQLGRTDFIDLFCAFFLRNHEPLFYSAPKIFFYQCVFYSDNTTRVRRVLLQKTISKSIDPHRIIAVFKKFFCIRPQKKENRKLFCSDPIVFCAPLFLQNNRSNSILLCSKS